MSFALLIEPPVSSPAAYANDADYQPGKIMFASWGYDQTNIDWFEMATIYLTHQSRLAFLPLDDLPSRHLPLQFLAGNLDQLASQ